MTIEPSDKEHQYIDVPFHFRYVCWFCGEPSARLFAFPQLAADFIHCPHSPIFIPTCNECHSLAKQTQAHAIWHCRDKVKKSLVKRYRKDLAIGKNWTKEELAKSDFQGGNFEGFARSAWFIFEVARDRVNYSGWPLWSGGEQIVNTIVGKEFVFDGVHFNDVEQAIDFYVATYDLDKQFLQEVLRIIGLDRFSYAIRYCRLYIGHTPNEKRMAVRDLENEESQ